MLLHTALLLCTLSAKWTSFVASDFDSAVLENLQLVPEPTSVI
jgi:hypothetical protein